jgi:hypothetical protein
MVSACVAVINPRLFFTYGGRRGVSRDFMMRDSGRCKICCLVSPLFYPYLFSES